MQSTKNYILQAEKYTAPIDWETSFHKHSFWEIIIGIKGEGIHFINETKYTLNPGDIIVMKPDSTHRNIIPDHNNYLHLDFYASLTAMKISCNNILENSYEKIQSDMTPFVLHVEKNFLDYIYTKLTQLRNIQNNPLFIELSTAIYNVMLNTISELMIEQQINFHAKTPQWLATLLIKMNNPKIICGTLQDVVALSNYSHGHLCKLFKQYTGEKLIDYLTKLKIDHSLDLLKNKNLNILDISSRLGYDSLSHFISVFKSYNGTTPKQYRKEILNIT